MHARRAEWSYLRLPLSMVIYRTIRERPYIAVSARSQVWSSSGIVLRGGRALRLAKTWAEQRGLICTLKAGLGSAEVGGIRLSFEIARE